MGVGGSIHPQSQITPEAHPHCVPCCMCDVSSAKVLILFIVPKGIRGLGGRKLRGAIKKISDSFTPYHISQTINEQSCEFVSNFSGNAVHTHESKRARCCFTSTETVGLLGTGAQDDHLDYHTASQPCLGVKEGSKHGA